MTTDQINIRDPFVVFEDNKYYLYGTRAKDFGHNVGGVDVYVSEDLVNWSEPVECLDSEKYGLNRSVNWAPEVHRYGGRYYMFITFTRENGRRGTYSLVSDSLIGPFVPNSRDALTPEDWECLDGTLYVNGNGEPYLVFCHEHTQIVDGTVCYAPLNEELTAVSGEVVTMFSAAESGIADPYHSYKHYITDGPFMYRAASGELFMLWSTFIKEKYAQCQVRFPEGELGHSFEHKTPLLDSDGGHGMIFSDGKQTYLTYHTPNTSGLEHPVFRVIKACGDELCLE